MMYYIEGFWLLIWLWGIIGSILTLGYLVRRVEKRVATLEHENKVLRKNLDDAFESIQDLIAKQGEISFSPRFDNDSHETRKKLQLKD